MTYEIVKGVSKFGGVDFQPYPLALRFKGQGVGVEKRNGIGPKTLLQKSC